MLPILRQTRTQFLNLPRASRIILALACAVFFLVCLSDNRNVRDFSQHVLDQHSSKQPDGVYLPKLTLGLPSVNLVVAATSEETYAWTQDLKVPGMVVVPYIADDPSAPHHPKRNKGHEAMMYLQYFYDFYDNLPDISILIHSQEKQWHVDDMLEQSMIFSLNHLDLREVQRREFLNLRVTWGIGCSAGSINTSRVIVESENDPPEERSMQEAFRVNFNVYNVPEILATPCCSQIAVTKEKILSVPREQYAHHIKWLLDTRLPDFISGRIWEHMWQYLFLQKAVDCPLEHKAYCLLYHICFGGYEEYDEWMELEQGRIKIEKELAKIEEEEEKEREEEEEREEEKERKLEAANIKIEKELAKIKEEEEKERKWEAEEKKKQEEFEENIEQQGEEMQEWEENIQKRNSVVEKKDEYRGKSETAKKAKEKMKKWLEDELKTIKETIRVKKEIAIVRGAVKANRIAEGENLYGDEVELGIEKLINVGLTPTPTATMSPNVQHLHRPQRSSSGY